MVRLYTVRLEVQVAANERQCETKSSAVYGHEQLYGVRTCPNLGMAMFVLRYTKLFVHGTEVAVPTLIYPRYMDVYYDAGDPDVPGIESGFLLAIEDTGQRIMAAVHQEQSPAVWLLVPPGLALQRLEIHTSDDVYIQRMSKIGNLSIGAYNSIAFFKEIHVGAAKVSVDGPLGSICATAVTCEDSDIRSRGPIVADANSLEYGFKPASRAGVFVVASDPLPIPAMVK